MKRLWSVMFVILGVRLASAQGAPASPQFLTVGKSTVIECPAGVARVAVAAGDIVEAVAVSEREVILNGKAPGETSVLIWQHNGGARLSYDVTVQASPARLEALRARLHTEIGNGVTADLDEKSVIVKGLVGTLADADRAMALAGTLGKPVNLMNIAAPPAEPQILLKVRFADLDRAASTELGANFLSTGAANTVGSLSTQQFSPPSPRVVDGNRAQFTVSDALNVFLFRPDLNLGATIRALQSKNLVQVLAEPNVLAINGKEASFLAGGEFPFPVVQGSAGGVSNVTIQFREFGIRLNFTPVVTPRGTIRLRVAPEVSSLDYANGLIYQGFNIPGLAVRRVETEIELADRQSFAIAGLLDNRLTETFNRVPGLGNIPLFGKLFQSRATSRNKSELLVVVTPELVNPIPAGSKLPALEMPKAFLKDGATAVPGGNPPAGGSLPVRPSLPAPAEPLRGGPETQPALPAQASTPSGRTR